MGSIKVTTAQFGARHNYAIPAALAGSGHLHRFFTDICGTRGAGRLATLAKRLNVANTSMAALSARRPPDAVIGRTTTFDRFALSLRRALGKADPITRLRLWDEAAIEFGNLIERHGLGETTVLYGMMHELGPLYGRARARGIKVAADVCIVPSWERRVREEQKRYPDWAAPEAQFSDALGHGVSPYRHMFDNLDLWVCPSEFVRDDLVNGFGISPGDTRVVPYAISDHWFDMDVRPHKGRVLFVGSANLRKGIHHLAAAAEKLNKEGDTYEFRVVGHVSDDIRNREETRHLQFIGQVPRSQVDSEFRAADVFVLPSIAEGSATVTYEALAAGLPIVTTHASGSVVTNGVEGYVSAEPDATRLAEAIANIVSDRALRQTMSERAREKAESYRWSNFKDNLSSVLVGMHQSEAVS